MMSYCKIWRAGAVTLAVVAGMIFSGRADVLISEDFGQNVPDNSPVDEAPGWRAYALFNGAVTDYTSATPNGNYPTISHSTAGAGTNGVGYLVLGAGNIVSNVLVWKETGATLQGKFISDLSFYTKNNSSASTERIVVRNGTQWFVSTTTLNDGGGNSVWVLNTFNFVTNASAWRVLNTNNLTLGTVLSTSLPTANLTAVGLFGQIQADSGKIRADEFIINGSATNAPPAISPPGITPGTNVYAGSAIVMSATGSGPGPLSYQWRRNGSNLANGSGISGATSASLTLSNVVTGQSGNYDVVVTNAFGASTSSIVPVTITVTVPATVDFSSYNNQGNVTVVDSGTNTLVVGWTNQAGRRFRAQFNLMPGQDLLRSIETSANGVAPFSTIAQNVDVKYRVTLGTRFIKAGAPYVFFDNVDANSPAPIPYLTRLDPKTVRVVNDGPQRVKLVFSTLEIGDFKGELTCHIYTGSPFLHFQAGMEVDQPWVAYIYDALFYANFANVAYRDSNGAFQTVTASSLSQTSPGEPAKVIAKHRTIMGTVTGGSGTLAMMSAPHTGVYPTDQSNNYGYQQAGKNFIGSKMSFSADGRYRPWIDAPIGSTQRMDIFLVISTNTPQGTLTNEVLSYTHGDVFKSLPGHYTMVEHFHPEFTANAMAGNDALTPFKQTMKAMGIQIVQPMEFHGPGHPFNNETDRLAELSAMFSLFEAESDDTFLLIPGEEYNNFFGGHWSYMFRKPVYFTAWPGQGSRPFRLTNAVVGGVTYPLVYQVGDADRMSQLLQEEGGIAWTSHPRVKASRQMPDIAVNNAFYQDASFLAGDWKAMPMDFSKDRLGFRSFQLMDDTAQWGYKKSMLGEVDTFSLAPTHEIYAHMNVNYLQLPAFPSKTNWSSVVDCIQNGDFFTTTGEVLIRAWNATTTGVTATVEWYFPPAFAEITWGDASGVHKLKQALATGQEFQTQQIAIPANLSAANWVRLEVWDVARNGAFTQIRWLNTPAQPAVIAGRTTSFTLINADTDTLVPGYDPIPEGATLNKALLPPNLTIRANIAPLLMDSVTLQLDGIGVTRTQWPYSLAPCTTGPGIGDSPTYDYAASALSIGNHTLSATPQRGTNVGQSLTLNFFVINTAPPTTNFVHDGAVDSADYQIVAGLGLYAAVRGNLLYVAAPTADANDQFILVSTNPGSLGAAPWNKAGQMAFNINAHPYLAQNGNTRAINWSNAGLGAQCPAAVTLGFMEGSFDLMQSFGSVPETIYLALARYTSGTGGALVAGNQTPAGNGNGTIEANEFLAVPVANLRDETLNGVPDVLEPNTAFSASFSNNPGTFIVRWPAIPSYSYQVVAAENPAQPFQPLSPTIIAGPGVFSLSYTDTPPAALVQRYYRACCLGGTDPLLVQLKFDGAALNSGPVSLTTTANAITYNSDSKQGGLAGDFDGATSSVTTSGNPVNGSFSVAFWLRTGNAGVGNAGDQWYSGTGLVDADTPGLTTDWGIALTGNAIGFGIGGGSAGANLTISSPAITDNNWHHVLVTWEQSTRQMKIYVDGQNVATGTSNSSEARVGAAALVIGRSATANRYFNGRLDDVQIYNRALTGAEAMFLLGFPGQTLH